jgi:hypothetical protein
MPTRTRSPAAIVWERCMAERRSTVALWCRGSD